MGRKQKIISIRCLIKHQWTSLYRTYLSDIEVFQCERCGKFKVYNHAAQDYYTTREDPTRTFRREDQC